jgi:hypothetical protein
VTRNLTHAQGRPFVASFFDYKPLLAAVIASFVLTLAVLFELSHGLNSLLEFSPFPSSEFRLQLIKIIVTDMIGTVVVESSAHLLLYKVSACSFVAIF